MERLGIIVQPTHLCHSTRYRYFCAPCMVSEVPLSDEVSKWHVAGICTCSYLTLVFGFEAFRMRCYLSHNILGVLLSCACCDVGSFAIPFYTVSHRGSRSVEESSVQLSL
ncbi:hypothetical protein BaRGS_00001896 [Batillaria attramentaria]|uniref:Uncharacterized protein n=1 Tax=Batillaria attramentaria TaxID=370345 RepID=A0ABD0M6B2_9CAEN